MLWKRLLLLVTLALAAAIPAGATSVLRVGLGAMVDQADLIFTGTVIGIESVPTRDGNYAFTYVTFDIEQTFKGASRAGKTITLRMAGGQAGPNYFEILGAPTFSIGGKHLLFVAGNDTLMVPVLGAFQGKFDIVDNPVSHQPMLADYRGFAVDGIEKDELRHGGMRLAKDGSLREPRDPGVTVIGQEGVRIEIDKEQRVERSAPVTQVLSELRSYVNRRKASSKSYKDSQFVESASQANVPATFGFTAIPAPNGGK